MKIPVVAGLPTEPLHSHSDRRFLRKRRTFRQRHLGQWGRSILHAAESVQPLTRLRATALLQWGTRQIPGERLRWLNTSVGYCRVGCCQSPCNGT